MDAFVDSLYIEVSEMSKLKYVLKEVRTRFE